MLLFVIPDLVTPVVKEAGTARVCVVHTAAMLVGYGL